MTGQRLCAACGERPMLPMGALCGDCSDVTATFTRKQWARVEAMTTEQANRYLLRRRDTLRRAGKL